MVKMNNYILSKRSNNPTIKNITDVIGNMVAVIRINGIHKKINLIVPNMVISPVHLLYTYNNTYNPIVKHKEVQNG